MDRPAPVRLDDLREPRFSPAAAELIAAGASLAEDVILEPDAVLEQAAAETGLDDFGPAIYREPLERLLAALRDEADLNDFGAMMVHHQLLTFAKNRLLVHDVLRRHPQIHDVDVDRPIVIAGLPRTGTTHLHNLLAADTALRSLPYWESVEPVLPEAEAPGPGEPDPRVARTHEALDFLDVAMPEFKRMHEMTVDHVHEEIQLLGNSFSTMLFDTMAPMPSWREYYRATDQTPFYEELRTTLKVLQFLRGGDRWVLKSPQHLEQFDVLRRVFPDATVLVTHRDPVAVTISMVTMIDYTSRLNLSPVPVDRIARYWSDLLGDMLASAAENREVLGEQSMDVHFDRFMDDDTATVRTIYALADQPLTATARHQVESYVANHPRGRHGTIDYDPDDLGLDLPALRRRFAPYVDRFDVTVET